MPVVSWGVCLLVCLCMQWGVWDKVSLSSETMKPREAGPGHPDPALRGPVCAQPCPHTAGLPHPQLLGLSMATLAAISYFGAHFAVIGRASSDRTPYEATRRWGK